MSEHGKFENEWKKVFSEAEVAPPDSTWTNIKAHIASNNTQKLRKRVVYWRWMAAASFTLLLGVSIASYFMTLSESSDAIAELEPTTKHNQSIISEDKDESEPNSKQNTSIEKYNDSPLSQHTPKSTSSAKSGNKTTDKESMQLDGLPAKNNIENLATNSSKNISSLKSNTKSINKKTSQSSDYKSNNYSSENNIQQLANINKTSLPLVFEEREGNEKIETKSKNAYFITSLKRKEATSITEPFSHIEPRKVPIYLEAITAYKDEKREKQDFGKMWVSVSFGGGNYNANTTRHDQKIIRSALTLNNNKNNEGSFGKGTDNNKNNKDNKNNKNNLSYIKQKSSQSVTSTVSYAISADFGKQIGKRTFLQSGVEYSRYAMTSTSSLVSSSKSKDPQVFTGYQIADVSTHQPLAVTDEYELVSTLEYITIPLSIGYKILNRRVGISLSSGISSSFFMQNTLKDRAGEKSSVKVRNGADSPYRPVNFNGLLGVNFSYQWKEQYQIALVPNYRFALNSATKSNALINSNPTAFVLGFRFVYFIK